MKTKITTTIKREHLAAIIDGSKHWEYREIKPYWTNKFEGVEVPFELRLINGMSKKAPEVTLSITGIFPERLNRVYCLFIGQVLNVKNWPPSKAKNKNAKRALRVRGRVPR
jgi:hypothetical protein